MAHKLLSLLTLLLILEELLGVEMAELFKLETHLQIKMQ
jgi:hypothetical protein